MMALKSNWVMEHPFRYSQLVFLNLQQTYRQED